MTTGNTKTHWLKNDFRIDSLIQIISGLEGAIALLKERMKYAPWYDSTFFLEDSEPIYGLAFIAFQNYINGSIKDLARTSSDKIKYYRISPNIKNYDKSDIELIVALANCWKHKEDEGLFHKGTLDILLNFNLNASKESDIDSSPIFDGLIILSENWDLQEILTSVRAWRANLLRISTEQHCI